MRASPARTSSQITTLAPGTVITSTGRINDRYFISIPSCGWVSKVNSKRYALLKEIDDFEEVNLNK